MATTISEAARRWGIGRGTIYRRMRAGRLNFATTSPFTVEASEMLRVFGEPRSRTKRDNNAAHDNAVALARVEAVCELVRAEAERMKSEMAMIKGELQAAQDNFHKELDRLLELLAARQRLIEAQLGKLPSALEQGETAEAQAVLAALERVERRGPH